LALPLQAVAALQAWAASRLRVSGLAVVRKQVRRPPPEPVRQEQPGDWLEPAWCW
jgi:hypothetical protein